MKDLFIKFLLLFCKKKTRRDMLAETYIIDGRIIIMPIDGYIEYKELFGKRYDGKCLPINIHQNCSIKHDWSVN